MVVGSTGKLYAQIVYGAPYDIFLAADQARPERLMSEGQAVSQSQFTYALGTLVVLGANRAEDLVSAQANRIALANPDLAPYGKAAEQVLQKLEYRDQLAPRLVLGENVGQAFAFVTTGNAQIGFVSEAQLRAFSGKLDMPVWRLAADFHDPIAQDAVLLQRAAQNPAALAFMTFLQSTEAKDIILRHGYDLP